MAFVSRLKGLAVLLVFLVAVPAHAGELVDEPVGPRIVLGKRRLLKTTASVGRQADAAFPSASSSNPAAADFLREPPADYDGLLSGTGVPVFFNNGASVTGGGGGGVVRLPEAGTLSVTYARFDSHDASSRQDNDFALRNNEIFIGYGHRLTEFLSVGGELHLTDASLAIESTPPEPATPALPPLPSETQTETFGAGFRLGALMALSEEVTVGAHGGIKWDDTETEVRIQGAPDPPDAEDTSRISDVRVGVGWQVREELGIFADAQHIVLENRSGHTGVGRGYLGAELRPTEDVTFRLGGVVDTQPKAGLSAGIGYHGIEDVTVQFSYAYNTLTELEREFGRSHVASVSVTGRF